MFEFRLEGIHRLAGGGEQPGHLFVALAALLDFVQAMAQRADEGGPAPVIAQQVVLQIGIAGDHPEIPQHLEQHACGAARAALAAQRFEHLPHLLPEETDDDFPVGKGRVVVGDFPQAGGHGVWSGKTAFYHLPPAAPTAHRLAARPTAP